jgi:glycosyltransferase involved in cell wall biosynthesis
MARIVHVVISGEIAGGQKVCLAIVKDRLLLGDDVVVVAPASGPFTEQCAEFARVELLRSGRLWDLWRVPKLIRFLRRTRADLVHTHVMVPGNILWRIAGRAAGVRVLNHVHAENYFGRDGAKARLVRRFDTWTASRADCFVAVSQHTATTLIGQGYPRDRIRVVYNAVPWESPPTTGPHPASGAPPVIGWVARLAESKGQRELIRAFSELASRHPSAQLWLVGKDQQSGGRFETELRSLAETLGVSNRTVFWGYRDDVKELMQRMTLFVLPSLTEAFPVALLEAMALGVPTVATEVAGVPEIITDGETGVLVPPGDVGALSRAMDRVLSDSDLAGSLGERGRESVTSRFTKEKMLREMRAIYSDLLGRPGAARH